MAVRLTINDRTLSAKAGKRTLFDYAEDISVRVPTSCKKQGKCKECIVEITQGSERLSLPNDFESHLPSRFRLSCQTRIVADKGEVHCHTMRRGQMRIEKRGFNLYPGSVASPTPSPGTSMKTRFLSSP
jgi:ferredoxin